MSRLNVIGVDKLYKGSSFEINMDSIKVLTCQIHNSSYTSLVYNGAFYRVPNGKSAKIIAFRVIGQAGGANCWMYTSVASVAFNATPPSGNAVLNTMNTTDGKFAYIPSTAVETSGVMTSASIPAGKYINMQIDGVNPKYCEITIIEF